MNQGVRGVLRTAIFENFALKILSLAFALGFYAFIHGAEEAQRTFSVPVVSIMPKEELNRQLMTPLPTEVAVTLRGSRTQLDDLRADDLGTLQIDLRKGRETSIELEPSMFNVPEGLTVEQIYPPRIDLRWDDVITRAVPVQVPRTGELAQGFEVKGTIAIDPASVKARGPRSVVDVMQFARTEAFDVTGLSEGTFERTLALENPPKLVSYDVDSVKAVIEVTREQVSRTFDRKVEVVGLPRARTTPPSVAVRVIGPPEAVNALAPEAIVPRVELKGPSIDPNQPGSAFVDVLVDVGRLQAEVSPPKVLVKW